MRIRVILPVLNEMLNMAEFASFCGDLQNRDYYLILLYW